MRERAGLEQQNACRLEHEKRDKQIEVGRPARIHRLLGRILQGDDGQRNHVGREGRAGVEHAEPSQIIHCLRDLHAGFAWAPRCCRPKKGDVQNHHDASGETDHLQIKQNRVLTLDFFGQQRDHHAEGDIEKRREIGQRDADAHQHQVAAGVTGERGGGSIRSRRWRQIQPSGYSTCSAQPHDAKNKPAPGAGAVNAGIKTVSVGHVVLL